MHRPSSLNLSPFNFDFKKNFKLLLFYIRNIFIFKLISRKIYWKLYLSNSILIFAILIFVLLTVINKFEVLLREERIHNLQDKISILEPLVLGCLKNKEYSTLQDQVSQITKLTSLRITILKKDGTVIADSDNEVVKSNINHWYRPEIQEALINDFGHSNRFSEMLNQNMFYIARSIIINNKVVGAIRLAIPRKSINTQIQNLILVILWISCFGIIIILICSYLLTRVITKPITELMSVCKSMLQGNYTKKVKILGKDEISRLGYTLNCLSDAIKSKIETISMERAQLKSMLKAMTEGILSIDSKNNILFCNQNAGKFLGYDPLKSTGKSLDNLMKSQILLPIIKEARFKETLVKKEIKFKISAKEHIVKLHISPFHLKDDYGMVIVIHDITRIRHLEKVRQDFVANVSHELKTPLTSINGYAETLLEGAIHDPNINSRFVEKIQKNSHRLYFLVKDILSLAKLESEHAHLNCVNKSWDKIIEQVLCQYEETCLKKKIRVSYKSQKGFQIHADPEFMRQILDNLLSNALRYTLPSGRVSIDIEEQGSFGVLRVTDNGIGIPENDLERIFERFYRVDKDRSRELGGTGLGLSIVKHLVSIMNGTIEVTSTLGHGSTFSVYLPRKKSP